MKEHYQRLYDECKLNYCEYCKHMTEHSLFSLLTDIFKSLSRWF